jgi:cyanophycin synthetase
MSESTTPKLNASSRIMFEEATSRGISCTTFGDNETIFMQHNGLSWYTRGSRTSSQSSIGFSIADKKALAKRILTHHNLPTAKAIAVKTEEDLNELSSLIFPVVMKPQQGTHGDGVVVGIPNEAEALEYFAKLNKPALFEEMLKGIEFRVVCVNFKFVAVAFRKPAHVVGDGAHTVTKLIAEKNKHPWRGKGHTNNLSLIEVDELVEKLLSEQQLTVESIPSEGQEVVLRRTANLSTGGEAWDVTDQVCPENRELFEQIARVCDLNVIGIDMMCQTLSTPIVEQKQAGVIEVNSSPGLRMHHYPIQGTPKNIAGLILDMVIAAKQNEASHV